MTLSFIFFGVLAILAIASAVVTVMSKSPVKSAMGLVVHFFMLAGLYLTLNAQFLAAIQVVVYAGAIMVLVIFVIMLLNLQSEEMIRQKFSPLSILSILLGIGLIVLLGSIYFSYKPGITMNNATAIKIGTPKNLGLELYTNYIIPVQAVGILLTAAIIGAIVLAKRKLEQ